MAKLKLLKSLFKQNLFHMFFQEISHRSKSIFNKFANTTQNQNNTTGNNNNKKNKKPNTIAQWYKSINKS